MQEVLSKARAAAATRATVLLMGESGTGKELIARAIHRLSADADQPFVPVHCGAIPENLIESELFGYNKGAFTDARKDTPGKFREAHGGTIFLDEVSTMPLSVQVRLLRVLQEREVQPLGGGAAIKVEVRVVTATNVDLWKRVQDGTFREDLFYRLEVVPIQLPPLRARQGGGALPGPALPEPQGPGARPLSQGPASLRGFPADGAALARERAPAGERHRAGHRAERRSGPCSPGRTSPSSTERVLRRRRRSWPRCPR